MSDKSRYLPSLVLFVSLLIIHASAYLVIYGYNDDYHILFDVLTDKFSFWDHPLTKDGRLVSAFFIQTIFSQFGEIADLRLARLGGVVGICFSAVVFHQILVRAEFGRVFAFSLALVAFTAPSFAVYSSWAVCFVYPWGTLACLYAGWCCHKAFFGQYRFAGRCTLGFISLILGLAAYWTYQPIGPFFLLPVLVLSWKPMRVERAFLLRLMGCFILFGVATVSYMLLNGLIVHHFGSDTSTRMSLVTGLSSRVEYLLAFSLPAIMGGWTALLGQKTAIFVTSFLLLATLAGLLVPFERLNLLRGLAGSLVFLLAISIFALPEEIYLAYRLYAAPTTVFLFLLWAAVERSGSWGQLFLKRKAALWRGGLGLLAGGWIAFWAVSCIYWSYWELRKLNAEEWNAIRLEGQRKLQEWPDQLQVILPAPYERTMKDVFVAEYQTRSSHMPWVAPRMFQLALYETLFPDQSIRESEREHPHFELYFALDSNREAPVLDLFSIVHESEIVRVQHPLFGPCDKVADLEYFNSPVFGPFDNTDYPYIYHLALGWLYVEDAESGLVTLMEHENQRAVLDPDLFPVLQFPDEDHERTLNPLLGFGPRFF